MTSGVHKVESGLAALFDCGADLPRLGHHVAALISSALDDVKKKKEIRLCTLMIFDANKGVLRFLQSPDVYRNKDLQKDVLKHLLSFLTTYLGKVAERDAASLHPHAPALKTTCATLIKCCDASPVKIEATKCLRKLLRLASVRKDGEDFPDLDVAKLGNELFAYVRLEVKKTQHSLLKELYDFLGLLAELFPDRCPFAETLKRFFLSTLRSTMEKTTVLESRDFNICSGCLFGLTGVLYQFSTLTEEETRLVFDLALKSVSKEVESATRSYDVVRGGLKLLARHAYILRRPLVAAYERLMDRLGFWINHKNAEMSSLASTCSYECVKIIAEVIADDEMALDDGVDSPLEIFHFFQRRLRDSEFLDETHSASSSTSSGATSSQFRAHRRAGAVKTYSLLAGVAKKFTKESESDVMSFMFERVLSATEAEIQVSSDSPLPWERLRLFPDFLLSLGHVIAALDDVSASLATRIERIVGKFFREFPHLAQSHSRTGCGALVNLLSTLQSTTPSFPLILQRIVRQSLMRVCLLPTKAEASRRQRVAAAESAGNDDAVETLAATGWENTMAARGQSMVGYQASLTPESDVALDSDLKPFNAASTSSIAVLTCDRFFPLWRHLLRDDYEGVCSPEAAQRLVGAVLAQFLDAVVFIVDRLDLETTVDEEKEATPDPLERLVASTPRDWQTVINLAETFVAALDGVPDAALKPWAPFVCRRLVVASLDFPLVSAFYKLLAFFFSVGRRVQVFDDDDDDDDDKDDDFLDLCRGFFKRKVKRIKAFHGELLNSLLKMLLSAPHRVVEGDPEAASLVVEAALDHGDASLSLSALDSLEHWTSRLSEKLWAPFLRAQVLTKLSRLLIGAGSKTTPEMTPETASSTKSRQKNVSHAALRHYAQRDRLLRQAGVDPGDDSPSAAHLVRRVLAFLGKIGSGAASSLTTVDRDAVFAWDSAKHVRLEIPFPSTRVFLYLDDFLPLVCDLALNAVDRQTKTSACELLHGVVVLAIGRSATTPDEARRQAPMDKFFERVFPVLLRLCVSTDAFVEGLFRKLTFPLVHWLTSGRDANSAEALAVVGAVTTSLASEDSRLQSVAADCFREFFLWFDRADGVGAKGLLKRVTAMARHPDAGKRMGAAVAFNRISTVFREKLKLVNLFFFDLVTGFLESLCLVDDDDEDDEDPVSSSSSSSVVVKELQTSLRHLRRILQHPDVRPLLSREDEESRGRRLPRGMEAASLKALSNWLLRRVGVRQTVARREILEFLAETLAAANSDPLTFVGRRLAQSGPQFFVDLFERNRVDAETVPIDNDPLRCDHGFLVDLHAALDCYAAFFGAKLLRPGAIFGVGSSAAPRVLTWIRHFVEEVNGLMFRRRETMFRQLKCRVVARLILFLRSLTKSGVDSLVLSEIIEEKMTRLLVDCLLSPSSLGFSSARGRGPRELGEETVGLIEDLAENHAPIAKEFKIVVRMEREEGFVASLLDSGVVSALEENSEKLERIVGLKCLVRVVPELFDSDWSVSALPCLFDVVVSSVSVDSTLTPSTKVVCSKILELVSELHSAQVSKVDGRFLSRLLLNPQRVESKRDGVVTRGDSFYSAFKSSLLTFVLQFDAALDSLVDEAVDGIDDRDFARGILRDVVDFSAGEKRKSEVVADVFRRRWRDVERMFYTKTDKEISLTIFKSFSNLAKRHDVSFPAMAESAARLLNAAETEPLEIKLLLLGILVGVAGFDEVLDKSLLRFIAFLSEDQRPPCLSAMLDVFSATGSAFVLKGLVHLSVRIGSAVDVDAESAVETSLIAAIRQQPAPRQADILDAVYAVFRREESTREMATQARVKAVDAFLSPLLRGARAKVVNEFFSRHLDSIKEGCLSSDSLADSELEAVAKLAVAAGCFVLIRFFFLYFSVEYLTDDSSSIPLQFKNGDSKNIRAFFANVASKRWEEMKHESSPPRLRHAHWRLRVAAFNALLSVVAVTQRGQKSEMFAVKLVFSKFDSFSANLIRQDEGFEFPVELEKALSRRRHFRAIRSGARDIADDPAPSTQFFGGETSSLMEDVSTYDLIPKSSQSIADVAEDELHSLAAADSGAVEIEMDCVNRHPVMAPLMDLVIDLATDITPSTSGDVIPGWFECLVKKLNTTSTQDKNSRVFVAKLLLNLAPHVRCYGRRLVEPLTKLVIELAEPSYFSMDLLLLLFSFSFEEKDHSDDLSLLAKYLTRHLHHEKNPIVRFNLEVFKTLLSVAKGAPDFKVPYDVIYGLIGKNEAGDQRVCVTGANALATLLLEGYPSAPKEELTSLDLLAKRIKALTDHLRGTAKRNLECFSEVLGLVLKSFVEKIAPPLQSRVDDHVVSCLERSEQEKFESFLHVLSGVTKHFPQLLSWPSCRRFATRVASRFSRLFGPIRLSAIEILHRLPAPLLTEIFADDAFLRENIADLVMTPVDADAAQLALFVFLKILRHSLEGVQRWSTMIRAASGIEKLPTKEAKLAAVEIMILVHDATKDDDKLKELRVISEKSLIDGLVDAEDDVALKSKSFWVSLLPNSPEDRLRSLFQLVYTPDQEDLFLSYSSNLLLESVSASPRFDDPFFEHPLSPCEFLPLNLQPGPQEQAPTMTPLFAETQTAAVGSAASLRLIEATQEASSRMQLFTPTMAPAASLDIETAVTDSSLLVSAKFKSGDRFSGSQTRKLLSGDVGAKRFVKGSADDVRDAAIRSQLRKKGERIRRIRSERKERVQAYRQYRQGDFPDIQLLKLSDLFVPLLSLASRDQRLALRLFSALGASILTGRPDARAAELSLVFNRILSESRFISPSFISCVLSISERVPACSLRPKLVAAASLSSFKSNLLNGVACLQKLALTSPRDHGNERNAKRRKIESEASKCPDDPGLRFDDGLGLQLARLLAEMENRDEATALLVRYASTGPAMLESWGPPLVDAVNEEANGMIKTALKKYQEIEVPEDPEAKIWIQECRVRCAAALQDWKEVDEALGDDAAIWSSPLKERLLSYKLKSLRNAEGRDPFAYVETCFEDAAKRAFLEGTFADELALVSAMKKKLEKADFYVETSYGAFVDAWSAADPLLSDARRRQLSTLRHLREIGEFIHVANRPSIDDALALIERWRRRPMDPRRDDLSSWQTSVTNRTTLTNVIASVLRRVDLDSDRFEMEATRFREESMLEFAEAGLFQRSFELTFRVLRGLKHSGPDKEMEAKILSLSGKLQTEAFRCGVDRKRNVHKAIRDLRSDAAPDAARLNVLADLYQVAALQLRSHLVAFDNPYVLGTLRLIKGDAAEEAAPIDAEAAFLDAARETLEKAASAPGANGKDFLALGVFMLQFVDSDDGTPSPIDAASFPSRIISAFLSAIKFQAASSHVHFPKLLSLVAADPNLAPSFCRDAASLPSWTALPFASQIVSYLNTPAAPVVIELLRRAAADYPFAVVYPLKVFAGSASKDLAPDIAALVAELDAKLPVVEAMISNLELLFDPEVALEKWVAETRTAMAKKEMDEGRFRRSLDELKEKLEPIGRRIGRGRKRIVDWILNKIEEICIADGSKLLRVGASLLEQLKVPPSVRGPTSMKLMDWAPWLAEFDAASTGIELEIPGQYTSFSKPDPLRHARVSCFDADFRSLQSKERPRRLRIVGDDAVERDFLLKGGAGDDIRVDARVQSILGVMNAVVGEESFLKTSSGVRTFKVIPLTPHSGLIEWIAKTETLKSFLERVAKENFKPERKFLDEARKIKKDGVCKQQEAGAAFGRIWALPAAEVAEIQRRSEASIPWNLLRRGLETMTTSPEAFVHLQSRWKESLAALSVAHYVLGIGDRHLSNVLVDKENGTLIGIDFGYSFGLSIQLLSTPELVPFRLTRQLRNVFLPHEVTPGAPSPLAARMASFLAAWRSHATLVAAVAEAFVNEPSTDWQTQAERLLQASAVSTASDSSADPTERIRFFPREKLKTLRRKLRGEHPVSVLRDEIAARHQPKGRAEWARLAAGDPRGVRAKICGGEDDVVSVEDQVKCLVDLALDVDVVGRLWIGWESHV